MGFSKIFQYKKGNKNIGFIYQCKCLDLVLLIGLFSFLTVFGWVVRSQTILARSGPNVAEASAKSIFQPNQNLVEYMPDQRNPDIATSQIPSRYWASECVDCQIQFSGITNRSLVLDNAGQPHVVYGGNRLYYARYDGIEWRSELVEPGGSGAAIVLDAHGYPHISSCSGGLAYAYKDGSGWHGEVLETRCFNTDIQLDSNGFPHISYYKYNHTGINNDLIYVYKDAGGWHSITVISDADFHYPPSLALDQQGFPHILYNYDFRINDIWIGRFVKYAYQNVDGWHFEITDEGGDGSLAIDDEGRIHISYQDSDRNLKYAYRVSGEWFYEMVDSSGGVEANWISLVLDNEGYPHISYWELSDPPLSYAYRDSAGWSVETAVGGDTGFCTSIDLDQHGNPHILYCNNAGPDAEDIRYAHLGPNGWHSEVIASDGSVGSLSSLAFDSSEQARISYADNDGYDDTADLKFAYQDAESWIIETLRGFGFESRLCGTSLVIDGNNKSHLSYIYGDYYIESPIDYYLEYAYQDATGWVFETVDADVNDCWPSTLALDANDDPHISYFVGNNLMYAYKAATEWYIETIEYENNASWSTSLALDSLGQPHIGFYDSTNQDLKYAYRDSTGWQIETVDSTGEVGYSTSLVLNTRDEPHLTYYDSSNQDLKYAHRDNTGWYIETVDSEGDVGASTAIALDSTGAAHISYEDTSNSSLKYAFREAGSWTTEIVVSGGYSSYSNHPWLWDSPSLAIDQNDQPHITYYDEYSLNITRLVQFSSFIYFPLISW